MQAIKLSFEKKGIKWYLLKDKFIEQEKLEINDDDIKKFAEKNASMLNIPVDKLVEIYKANNELNSRLLSNKVLDMIIENATVNEVEEIKKPGERNEGNDLIS